MIRTLRYLILALCLTQVTTAHGSGISIQIDDSQEAPRSQLVNTEDAVKIDETASALSIHLATDIFYLGAQAVKPLAFSADTNYQGMIFYINLARFSTLIGANGYAWNAYGRVPTLENAVVATLLLLHAVGDITHALPQEAFKFVYQHIKSIPVLAVILNTFGEYVSPSVLLAALTSTILITKYQRSGDMQKILAFAWSVLTQAAPQEDPRKTKRD